MDSFKFIACTYKNAKHVYTKLVKILLAFEDNFSITPAHYQDILLGLLGREQGEKETRRIIVKTINNKQDISVNTQDFDPHN